MIDVKEILTSYLEKVKTSEYAPLLNALYQMQESAAYAARRSVLVDVERAIVSLERELADTRYRLADANGWLEHYTKGDPSVWKALKEENANLKKVIENDTENEEAVRKVAAAWDKTDSYGQYPLVDIVKDIIGELATAKEDQRIKDAEIALNADLSSMPPVGASNYHAGWWDACHHIANAIERGE